MSVKIVIFQASFMFIYQIEAYFKQIKLLKCMFCVILIPFMILGRFTIYLNLFFFGRIFRTVATLVAAHWSPCISLIFYFFRCIQYLLTTLLTLATKITLNQLLTQCNALLPPKPPTWPTVHRNAKHRVPILFSAVCEN